MRAWPSRETRCVSVDAAKENQKLLPSSSGPHALFLQRNTDAQFAVVEQLYQSNLTCNKISIACK